MCDLDLIDVESLDFSDDQTWLYKVPNDSGQKVDIVDWSLSLDWPLYEDDEYLTTEGEIYAMLDEILKNQSLSIPDKHKFDSRTYVKPKRKAQRPSINSIVEQPSNAQPANKYMTYNKYSSPLGPMLRLKTFNVDGNTENSNAIKEYAMKRRSLVQEDESQLEDMQITLTSDTSDRLSDPPLPSKPISIDYSQPAHNLHNTFNKGLPTIVSDRGSLNMYQSGESLMRMSPPSLVSSLLMESSGHFNLESLEGRKSSLNPHRDSGIPPAGRDSIDPMMTSMTLSILDEKDMSTSFLSQTTYPDHDSLMDSLPPSLVSSINSSYVVPNTPKARTDSINSENNVFSSATFTHLEHSERLLSARPRCHQLYNSFTKRDSGLRTSESYTKSREEACQIDASKVLNGNGDSKDIPKPKNSMTDTVTLHYSNNRFRSDDAEKENVNTSFEKDDAFYKDMGIQRTDPGKSSMNVTLDKQELNEIIQARQKLSLARKALPSDVTPLPNQIEVLPKNTSHTTVILPRKSIENSPELLGRRRGYTNGFDDGGEPAREPPKRNATFKKTSPRVSSIDTTVVFVKDDKPVIDINSATVNLVDGEKTLQQEDWGSQERAMVGSSDSTDTGTFSSCSPPESVPDHLPAGDPRTHVASTPLTSARSNRKNNLMALHTTISPIYNMVDDASYTVTKIAGSKPGEPINTNTIKKSVPKRDILANRLSPEKKVPTTYPLVKMLSTGSYTSMAPPEGIPRKTGLPTSKLRQYSSHKDLRLPGTAAAPTSGLHLPRGAGRAMVRRSVYASHPALSPTAPNPPTMCPSVNPQPPIRRDSYTIALNQAAQDEAVKSSLPNPPTLVRQGTETLRPRPQSQLLQPRDPPNQRPYTAISQPKPTALRTASRPVSGSVLPKPVPATTSTDQRPSSCVEPRQSALPRPSRLPAPKRTLRPPSVYSTAPTSDDLY